MHFDKDKASRNTDAILEKMYGDTDIALLKEYHKIYKKRVSLFRRSWAAAWLLMYYDQRETPDTPPLKNEKRKTQNTEEKSFSAAEITLPEEESKRLFISIGKNRRLFPREVISLIMSKTTSAREDIGIIRILDNYSFVQVRDTKADEIIASLNGIRFRGRTLAVNFAKSKNDAAESAAENM